MYLSAFCVQSVGLFCAASLYEITYLFNENNPTWKWLILLWLFSSDFRFFSDFLTIFFILTCFISLIDCNRLLWNMNFWCSFLNWNKLYFVILLNFCMSCEFFTVIDIGNKKKMMFCIVYTVLWIWISHINKYWICI